MHEELLILSNFKLLSGYIYYGKHDI